MGDSSGASTTPWGWQAQRTLVASIHHAGHDERERALFRAATKGGSNVAAGHISAGELHEALSEAGAAVGLSRARIKRNIRRGMEIGGRTPIGPSKRDQARADATVARRQAGLWLAAVMAADPPEGTRASTWATTKAMLQAIGLECVEHGRFETSLSYRQLAELAGVSESTVHAHLDRMRRWLTITSNGRGPKAATTWRLRAVAAPDSPADAPVTLDPTQDTFHGNKRLWAAYSVLSQDAPATFAEMAKAAGVGVRTVRRYVAAGVAAGKVAVVAGGVIALAALAVGPSTKNERRAERHAAERKHYAEVIGKVRDRIGGTVAQAAEVVHQARRWAREKRRRAGLGRRARDFEQRKATAPVLRPDGAERFAPTVGLGVA